MEFANKSRPVLAALLVFASTAILVWFGNGLNPWWPLLWLAPLPALWFALRSSWPVAVVTPGLAWLAGSLNMWGYLHSLGAPFTMWLEFFGVAALVFALAVLLFRALALRGGTWSAMLAFPAAWVSAEYLRNLVSVHGTAGNLAYTQLRFLPLLQIASITGPWGISFLLLLLPASLALGLHLRKTAPRRTVQVVGAAIAVIAAVLIFGTVRLALPASSQKMTVGLIASDEPSHARIAPQGAETTGVFREYAAQAARMAARGARVIVLPEKIGVVTEYEDKSADLIFQSLADRTGATLVVGEVHVTPAAQYNQARVYSPGASVRTYDKHHLLPPFESSLTPGTALLAISGHSEIWGVEICKDMDFTPLSRVYGQKGVGLMLAPAWDFNVDRTWHGHMAVMRGVEDGFSIVRAARNGYLTVSDDRGRILAEARSDSAPFATLLAQAPVTHTKTLYLRMGNWFGWLAMAILALTILRLFRLSRRSVDRINDSGD